ncbi:UNVERIFIED_ORG: hypothetical protein GGR78_000472 [Xanthomonas campestris]
MTKFKCASDITPEEYELQVKVWLESVGHELDSFSAAHREVLSSADGEYEIDVVVRFKALGGVQFKTLVECKKHKDPIIERASASSAPETTVSWRKQGNSFQYIRLSRWRG